MIKQSHLCLGMYPEELKAGSWGDMNTHVCSSIIQNSQEAEDAKYPAVEEWKNKMLYQHTRKYRQP